MNEDPFYRPGGPQGPATPQPPMSSQGPILSQPGSLPQQQPTPSNTHGQKTPVQHDAPTEAFIPAAAPEVPIAPIQRAPVRPEQLIRKDPTQSLPPGPPQAKLAYLWHSDPAYKVLFIAIGVVLLCSIIGVVLLSTAFSHSGMPSNISTANGNLAPTPSPKGMASKSSQPTPKPTSQPTPTPTPLSSPTPQPTTPTPVPTTAPTPTPVPVGPLTVQISGVPGVVNNHSTIPVTVTTNHPGAQVTLAVTYTGLPAFQQSGTQTTNGNGTTVIYLTINEQPFGFMSKISANLTATAKDQKGQTASSSTSFQVRMN